MKVAFLLILLTLVACSSSLTQRETENEALSYVITHGKFFTTESGDAKPDFSVVNSSKTEKGWDVVIDVRDPNTGKDAMLLVSMGSSGDVLSMSKILT